MTTEFIKVPMGGYEVILAKSSIAMVEYHENVKFCKVTLTIANETDEAKQKTLITACSFTEMWNMLNQAPK